MSIPTEYTTDPALLFLEIPIYSNNTIAQRSIQEINVDGGNEDLDIETNRTYFDAGGGTTVTIKNEKRNIFWKTHGNILELSEHSANVSLLHNTRRITIENTVILPNVTIQHANNKVFIMFGTLHAVYRLILDTTLQQNNTFSLLAQLSADDLEGNNVVYHSQPDGPICLASGLKKADKGLSLTSVFAVSTESGQIHLLKMPLKGHPSSVQMKTVSRVSRISQMFSAINPWGAGSDNENPCDLCIAALNTSRALVVAICNDLKLRLWSCKTGECLSVTPLHTFIKDVDPQSNAKCHKVRSIFNEDTNCVTISVYLDLGKDSIFVNFNYNIKYKHEVTHLTNLSLPVTLPEAATVRLVDFQTSLDHHLWALFAESTENQTYAVVCNIKQTNWHDIVPAVPDPFPEISIPADQSVKDAFIHELFVSGKFSHHAIAKALAASNYLKLQMASSASWKTLRANVLQTISQKVQSLGPVPTGEGEDDDDSGGMDELEYLVFQEFYQLCVVYQRVVNKPIGLTCPDDEGISVIKKDHHSYLVPVPTLEAVCRGAPVTLYPEELFSKEGQYDNLRQLLTSVMDTAQRLEPDFIDNMLLVLSQPCPESKLCALIADEIDSISAEAVCFGPFATLIAKKELVGAAQALVACIEPDTTEMLLDPGMSHINLNDVGYELLSRSVRQYVRGRLELLLLLLTLIIIYKKEYHRNEVEDEARRLDQLVLNLRAQIESSIMAYHSIWWIIQSETEEGTTPPSSLERGFQLLSMGEGVKQAPHGSLLTYYLKSELSSILATIPEFAGTITSSLVPKITSSIVKALWPRGPAFSFQPFLLAKQQITRLEQYVGLLSESNYSNDSDRVTEFLPSYTNYLLAHCSLHRGDPVGARKNFIKAAKKIHTEDLFYINVLQINPNEYTQNDVQMFYFTKVIEILENAQLSEELIAFLTYAETHLLKSVSDPGNMATLYSTLFKHYYNLRDYGGCYLSIIKNPDYDLRKSYLRRLIVGICERKEYKTLVEFSCQEMMDDFVDILEEKARNCDVMSTPPTYYELLFSFHVLNENYRKAASIKYENSLRLADSAHQTAYPLSLKKRHDCLLVAKHCLLLAHQENQWLVHPLSLAKGNQISLSSVNTAVNSGVVPKKLCIKEVSDISREILLCDAQMSIIASSKEEDTLQSDLSPQETVSLLIHVNLFDTAFEICKAFKLDMRPVFEAVTTKCVHAACTDEEETWEWLGKNSAPTGLSHGHSNITMLAYDRLKAYLEAHDKGKYYRNVAEILLSYRCTLPAWFTKQYKVRNGPELIRLLISYDYLQQATELCIEYLDCVLGESPERFNVKATLLGKYPVWTPRSEMDWLLSILDTIEDDEKLCKVKAELEGKLDDYEETLERKFVEIFS